MEAPVHRLTCIVVAGLSTIASPALNGANGGTGGAAGGNGAGLATRMSQAMKRKSSAVNSHTRYSVGLWPGEPKDDSERPDEARLADWLCTHKCGDIRVAVHPSGLALLLLRYPPNLT